MHEERPMKVVIVLAMHGAPPLDFPKAELGEFMSIQTAMEHAHGQSYSFWRRRYDELEQKMRQWARTPENDPFYAGSQDLANQLRRATGHMVIVGFNEFCSPSLDEALDLAAGQAAERIIIVTPMMTRGGEHSERDIPDAVERARERHPMENFAYIWPFPSTEVAEFLAAQIAKSL